MFLHLTRNGPGFAVVDGHEIIAVSDSIEDARRAGMIEATRRGKYLINAIEEKKIRRALT